MLFLLAGAAMYLAPPDVPDIDSPMLLQQRAIERDLLLSGDQRSRLAEAFRGLEPERQGIVGPPFLIPFGGRRPGNVTPDQLREENRKLSADYRERIGKRPELARKYDEAIKGILDAKQYERYTQLRMQRAMPAICERHKVADALGLSREQRLRVGEICRKMAAAMRTELDKILEGTEDAGPAERAKRIEEYTKLPFEQQSLRKQREREAAAREEATAAVIALLTDEQKEKWKAIAGAPFNFGELRQGAPFNFGELRQAKVKRWVFRLCSG